MLEEFVGSKVKVKILRLLLAEQSREFSQQDIAFSLGLSTGSVGPALGQLLRSRTIVARRVGRSRAFWINRQHPLYKPLASLFREETASLVSVAREFANDLPLPGVAAVILFGSVARGTPSLRSDLDVLVVVDAPSRAASVEPVAGAMLERHDVNLSPLILSVKEVRQRLRSFDPLMLTIAEEGKLLRGKANWLGR